MGVNYELTNYVIGNIDLFYALTLLLRVRATNVDTYTKDDSTKVSLRFATKH